MPQLWTETFVTQYFWFIFILLVFYFFIATKFIPNVANTLKARQINENTEIKSENVTNTKTSDLFNQNIKQEHNILLSLPNWETIQNEWLLTKPEENNQYWIESTLTNESKEQLNIVEEEELSLEEFLKSDENPANNTAGNIN